MSLILKGIDLPKKSENHVLVIHDDGRVEMAFGTDRGTELVLWTEAIQIQKDDEEAIDILMKVRQGIREGEDHEPNIKRG